MSRNNKNGSGASKKSSSFIWILLLLVLVACGAAGFTYYEMHKMKTDGVANNAQPKQEEITAPIYIPLDTFTVSLAPNQNEDYRVLYIGLTLRVKDENSKVLVEKFLPEIRSRLLIVFSEKTADSLATHDGKHALIDEIKNVVSKPLTANNSANVTEVLFNAFILR